MKRNIFIWLFLFVFIGAAYAQTKEDRTKGLKKISQDRENSTSRYHRDYSSLSELADLAEIGVEAGLSAIEINIDNLDVVFDNFENIFEDLSQEMEVSLRDVEINLRDIEVDLKDIDIDIDELNYHIHDLDIDRIMHHACDATDEALRETQKALKNLKPKRQKPQE